MGARGRAAAAALVLLGLAGCVRAPEVRFPLADGRTVRVVVEIADTPAARARGLMYRRSLPPDHGMLFVFPRSGRHRFWMKNTPLSLDLVYISADRRVVGVVERAVPFSTTPFGVAEPARYVLEVPAGFVARYRLRPGQRVEFHRIRAPRSP